jgi:hypothetical protein
MLTEVYLHPGDLYLSKGGVQIAIQHAIGDIYLQPIRPLGDISWNYPCTDEIMKAMIKHKMHEYQKHVDVFLESIANEMWAEWEIDKKKLKQPELFNAKGSQCSEM